MYRLDRMRKQYEALTAAEAYIIGFEKDGLIYGAYMNKIPRKYTRVQKECSSAGGGYGLYVDVKSKKARNELIKKGAVVMGTLEELESGEYNRGVMFEKMVYENNGQEFRGKDSIPFHVAGDITLNDKEVQVKYLHARICYDKTLKKLSKKER